MRRGGNRHVMMTSRPSCSYARVELQYDSQSPSWSKPRVMALLRPPSLNQHSYRP